MWATDVFDTYKEYVDGKASSSTTGFGIDVGPIVSAELNKDSGEKKKSESESGGQGSRGKI